MTVVSSNISSCYLCFSSCCSLVTKSCLTFCNSMDCSTPGFPVLYYLPEFAQTHVHWVIDAIQPSHPLSPPSPPALNLSQHQCLFQRVGSLHQVAKGLGLQLQHQSFQWIFRVDFLSDWLAWSLCSLRDYQESYPALLFQKHQFFSTQPSLWFNSHIWTDYWKNHRFDHMDLCWPSDVSAF